MYQDITGSIGLDMSTRFNELRFMCECETYFDSLINMVLADCVKCISMVQWNYSGVDVSRNEVIANSITVNRTSFISMGSMYLPIDAISEYITMLMAAICNSVERTAKIMDKKLYIVECQVSLSAYYIRCGCME